MRIIPHLTRGIAYHDLGQIRRSVPTTRDENGSVLQPMIPLFPGELTLLAHRFPASILQPFDRWGTRRFRHQVVSLRLRHERLIDMVKMVEGPERDFLRQPKKHRRREDLP